MFRKRTDQDFSEEVRAHLTLEADQLEREGLSRAEAEAAARRRFGNVTHREEQFHEAGRWMWLDHLAKDVLYACRQMRLAPVATATVILSLALGIGVNTAIFSLADQALLRTLPVQEPDRLVQLDWKGKFVGVGMGSVGYGSLIPYSLYKELRADSQVFTDLFARASGNVHLGVGPHAEPASVEMVTGSYFPTLGVRPVLGRLLSEEDDRLRDGHPVAVLSHDYWQSKLAGDPNIVGKQVRMNNYPLTVVGVAERSFRGTDWGMAPAIWIPLMMKSKVTPDWDGLQERRTRFLNVFARLKPGMTREQAQARVQPWFKAYLEADTRREGWPPVTKSQLQQYMGSQLDLLPGGQGQAPMRQLLQRPMLILLAATGLILLLACLNVANLSLARVLARRRTTALRIALGASRRRILTEQLVESGVFAVLGCAAGVLLAVPVIRGILTFVPTFGAASLALTAELDWRVLSFALAATAVTTLLAGTAPAVYAASVQPVNALKEQSTAVAGGMGLRKALVVGQFALALVLLVGAGLFARTLGALRAQGPRFPTANLLMFRLSPLSDGQTVPESRHLFRRLLTAIQALPEVEQAGIARWEMLRGDGWNNPVTVQAGRRFVTEDSVTMNAVTPDFFRTLGATITRGRAFEERDATTKTTEWDLRSAVINEEFVRRYFQGEEPIGARMGMGNGPNSVPTIKVVGVVKNFSDFGLRNPEPQVYFALWERTVEEGTFYVRSRSSSDVAATSIRSVAAQIDPALTVHSMRTIQDQLDRLLVAERLLAALASGFAILATLLAMIGLYGVLSFSAASRAKEISIRLAVGAPRWSAGGLIVKEAAVLAGAAMVIALPCSWAMGRLIESMLFGVRPMDAPTVVGAAVVLALVCLVASAVPARRAGNLSPLDTLKGS
ncbi:MAG TPA: ABC transporter permease [Bryobacteraceae bacterium]|nr:ABC transporter permease [Bryobacteraceae bacterium]